LTSKSSFLSLQKDKREMRLALKHFVYAPDMAERFDIYFSPLVPTETSGMLVLDFFRPGSLQTYASSGLQFQMASLSPKKMMQLKVTSIGTVQKLARQSLTWVRTAVCLPITSPNSLGQLAGLSPLNPIR
jgi:hypothetical protein